MIPHPGQSNPVIAGLPPSYGASHAMRLKKCLFDSVPEESIKCALTKALQTPTVQAQMASSGLYWHTLTFTLPISRPTALVDITLNLPFPCDRRHRQALAHGMLHLHRPPRHQQMWTCRVFLRPVPAPRQGLDLRSQVRHVWRWHGLVRHHLDHLAQYSVLIFVRSKSSGTEGDSEQIPFLYPTSSEQTPVYPFPHSVSLTQRACLIVCTAAVDMAACLMTCCR